MSKQIKKISLSLELVDQVTGYLASRPYAEVFQLMNGIQTEARACLEAGTKKSESIPAEDKPKSI